MTSAHGSTLIPSRRDYSDYTFTRSDQSDREINRDDEVDEPANIAPLERWVSLAAGAGLVGFGLYERRMLGIASAIGGMMLIARGATGYCPMRDAIDDHGTEVEGDEDNGIEFEDDAHRQAHDLYVRGVHVAREINIEAPVEKLWPFWRDLTNLPRVMSHLESVAVIDDSRSRWRVKGPLGTHVEWDAEIINDQPNELLAWQSMGDADVTNAGSVHFTPTRNGRSTRVKVTLEYIPTGGRAGAWLAKLFGEEPSIQIADDLQRFKNTMEEREKAK